MKQGDSDQSDSDNESLVKRGVLSVFRHRKRIDDDTRISVAMFNRLQESLTCPICLEVFVEAVYIKDCSHRFCKQCIEKYIRSQGRKCPTCRKQIGTKRQLRVDENILFLMQTVFGDVEAFRVFEENQRKIILEEMKLFDPKSVKRLRTKVDDEYRPIAAKRSRKKVCTAESVKQDEPEDHESHETVEPQDLDEEDLNKRLLVQLKQGVPFTITLQLLKYPDSVCSPQIRESVLCMPWSIGTHELASTICQQLHLKYVKYGQYVTFFVKQVNDFLPVEPGTVMEQLNKTVWNYYRDIEEWLPEEQPVRMVEKEKYPLGSKRILYYDLDPAIYEL